MPGVLWARPVAYFSAEFGLHESVPIYSGGLGVLAGDHIKSASDLGVPLVGIGLYLRPRLFQAAPRYRRLAAGRISRLDDREAADGAGRGQRRAAGRRCAIETRTGPQSWPGCGRSPSGGTRCICWIPTSMAIGPRIASSPRGSTAAISACASGRNWCSAWAACGRCGRWAFRRALIHLNEGHSAFAALEVIRAADGGRGHALRRRHARRRLPHRLHHAHARARRPRSLLRRH